jgi:drug/metabolite transporter (DMT)-like permease
VRDLFDFLLAPVRRLPWRVATVFGALLSLILVAGDVVAMSGLLRHVLGEGTAVAACFAAGFVGASRRREFDQGILAVFAAIVIANLVGAIVIVSSLAGTHSASAVAEALDLPLPGMLLVGVPIGTVGAGIATWLSHRASAVP